MGLISEARVARHELAVEMAAPTGRVWGALTHEMHRWWLPDFRMAPGHQRMVLELAAGGRWYEDAGEKGALLWGTVIAFEPEVSLHLAGDIAPPWGAARTYMHIRLEGAAARTTVHVTVVMIGDVDEAHGASIEAGWGQLFRDGLKRFVEGG